MSSSYRSQAAHALKEQAIVQETVPRVQKMLEVSLGLLNEPYRTRTLAQPLLEAYFGRNRRAIGAVKTALLRLQRRAKLEYFSIANTMSPWPVLYSLPVHSAIPEGTCIDVGFSSTHILARPDVMGARRGHRIFLATEIIPGGSSLQWHTYYDTVVPHDGLALRLYRDNIDHVLIHELAHAVLDADDLGYGARSCQALAASTPRDYNRLLSNADSISMFVTLLCLTAKYPQWDFTEDRVVRRS